MRSKKRHAYPTINMKGKGGGESGIRGERESAIGGREERGQEQKTWRELGQTQTNVTSKTTQRKQSGLGTCN